MVTSLVAENEQLAGGRCFERTDFPGYFLISLAQKDHTVFERGALERLQVLPVLEDARSLPREAGQTSIRTSSTTPPPSSRECMSFRLPQSRMSLPRAAP